MKPAHLEDDAEPGFFQRSKVMLSAGVLAFASSSCAHPPPQPAKTAPAPEVVAAPPVAPALSAGAPVGRLGGSPTVRWMGQFHHGLQGSLRGSPELSHVGGGVLCRLWLDESGRVTRVVPDARTASAADVALLQRALLGLQLEPAPPGTPMPVHVLLNAQKSFGQPPAKPAFP